MKRVNVLAVITLLFFALFTVHAFAGQKAGGQAAVTGESQMKAHSAMRADDMMGKELKNQQGEDLGKINDLVISDDGRVLFAVVSHGGVLGVDEKLTAVPWQSISRGAQEDEFLVNIDKERFDNAPTFSRDELANLGDPDQSREVYGYYGVEPEGHSGMSPHRDTSPGTMQEGQSGSRMQDRL